MSKTWKNIELKVARYFGGERVPITGRARGSAPDVLHPTLSIEVKHRNALPGWILEAMEQAEMSRKDGQVAVAILHPKGGSIAESLTVMRCVDIMRILRQVEALEEELQDARDKLQFYGGEP